jgi:hypothetical protein
MTPEEREAETLPAPPPDLSCRCDDIAPWDQWIEPKFWTDCDGRECEMRSCASCGCSVSRLGGRREQR